MSSVVLLKEELRELPGVTGMDICNPKATPRYLPNPNCLRPQSQGDMLIGAWVVEMVEGAC